MSPVEERAQLIETLRTFGENEKHAVLLALIKRKLNIGDLGFLSNRILIGSRGFGSVPSPDSFEANIGTLYAVRQGVVLYVPSQEVAEHFYGEYGFLVPASDGNFQVETIPKRRGNALFSAGVVCGPNEFLSIAGYNRPEKEANSTDYGHVARFSSHRWECELKPWLLHWLPF